ncbi:MAG: hypothetical protein ABF820_11780 [Sporolactobacillus sp.]
MISIAAAIKDETISFKKFVEIVQSQPIGNWHNTKAIYKVWFGNEQKTDKTCNRKRQLADALELTHEELARPFI